MDKYIGFDIDSKKTIASVVQRGKKDRFTTLKTDINRMKDFLNGQRRDGEKLHLTFEISGEAGYRHDALINLVDSITVSNPTKMTWRGFRPQPKFEALNPKSETISNYRNSNVQNKNIATKKLKRHKRAAEVQRDSERI